MANIKCPSCITNEGVKCWPGERKCSECGWNPVVSRARLNAFCKAHGIKRPTENAEKQENY